MDIVFASIAVLGLDGVLGFVLLQALNSNARVAIVNIRFMLVGWGYKKPATPFLRVLI